MGCCGQKRAALSKTITTSKTNTLIGNSGRTYSIARPAAPASQPTSSGGSPGQGAPPAKETPPLGGSVPIRYLERSRILVPGPATGRTYEFSGAHPCQSVDARDAAILLRTRFFSRV